MSVAKESKWCDEAHAALCGALADALFDAGSSPAKHKDAIMDFMASKGQAFTWEGIRQHLQKLRRKEGNAAAANGGNDEASPRGPKKPNGGQNGPKNQTPKKRGPKRKSTKTEDDEEEDMNDASPTKKVKTENNTTNPLSGDEDEDPLPPFTC